MMLHACAFVAMGICFFNNPWKLDASELLNYIVNI